MSLVSTGCVLHRDINFHEERGPRIAAKSLGMQNKQRRRLLSGASAATPAFRAYVPEPQYSAACKVPAPRELSR